MDISIKNTSLNESTLIWAVIGSIFVHTLMFVVIPNFKFDALKKVPDVLKVEIVQAKKPEPVKLTEPVPAPPKPAEPIKPKPELAKPLPKKLPKTEPLPAKENAPEVPQTEPVPKPNIIAVTPKADTTPAIVVPTPEPPKEKPENDDAYNMAKSNYVRDIQKEIQRNLRYPNRLKKHHVAGRAIVGYSLDNEGNVTSITIVSSSGNDILDAEAMDVIKRSNLKQYMNKVLYGRIDYLTTPVSFTLPEE